MLRDYAEVAATVYVVALNATWYAAKFFLRGQGKSVAWGSRHFQDLTSLKDLARQSVEVEVQRRARRFLWLLRVGLIIFLLLALPLFFYGATKPPSGATQGISAFGSAGLEAHSCRPSQK